MGVTSTPARRAAAGCAASVAVLLVAGALLPNGLPFGVVCLGVVLGGLSSLTAMGLVLVYRSARIINFAQAEIGGLAATVAVILVAGSDLPYFVALPIGLAVAVATGALIDATVVRRFFTAPRLILTVATVGLAQLLGALELGLPSAFSGLRPLTTFTTPFTFRHRIGPIMFTGDYLVASFVVPAVLAALVWFFARTDTGIAVRAASDSNERALLLGIPVRRLSRTTWMVAAGLSGLASMLAAPILGPQLGVVAGPTALLAPLAAAVVARMESLPVAVGASVAIGVMEQAIFWSYPRSSSVDVALFVVVLVALLLQRRRTTRVSDTGLGGYIAVQEVRPVPAVLARLPEVRWTRAGAWVALALLTVAVPLALDNSSLTLLAYVAIYGVLAVSLVVLTGWAGQVSLGQFAFAGVGGAATGSLLYHAHLDLFVALVVAATVGAVASVLVGVPALRMPGLFFAATTLAFGVPVSTFLLNQTYFPTLSPSRVARPIVLGRIDLSSALAFYYFCVAVLAACYLVAANLRRSRAGRVIVATRDNERAAAAFGVEPTRAKLSAFAFAGAMAGVAGGLYVVGLRGVPFSGFSPIASLQVFTMVVIGGLGSLPGALLGAAYVEGAQHFLHGATQLLATGAGLLVLLMVVPGGLGQLAYRARDRLLAAAARRRGVAVPSFTERADAAGSSADAAPITPSVTASDGIAVASSAPAMLELRAADAAYGPVQVLFGVDLDVGDGEIVALLGTNGAGKSTVLRVLAGLMPGGPGRVVLDGRDITELDVIARVEAGLVTVPGGRGVFGSLTVAENLRLAGWLARDDAAFLERARQRIFELFPRLEERLETTASSLSGGEQQMLTLAQALLCRPKLLLIDELSLGLAPTVVADLLDVVREINASGASIVVVEQSVSVALGLAERAVFMERGEVRFTGPTAELAARPDLARAVFLEHAGMSSGGRPRPARSAIADRAPDATDETAALELIDVTRSFGGVTAVDGVSFAARRGRVLGVIGANGAGKTTTFDLCSGFLAADRGRILFEGVDVTRMRPAERAELGLGRSFQDARLFPTMTVAEAVAVAVERHVDVREPIACAFRLGAAVDSERAVDARVDELTDLLGLGRYRNAFVSELSTGTRRIVELACALAHEPSVLLLDEPCAGIAQRETEALAALLLRVRDLTGATLVVIEHDLAMLTAIADDLLCMHLGAVLTSGAPDVVLADAGVIAAYLGDVDRPREEALLSAT